MTDELPLTTDVMPATRDELVVDLFHTHYRPLVGMARLLVDGEAEEVVQESFTRLYALFRRLDNPDKALAYLRTTVLNQCRSRLRRRRTARDKQHLLPRVDTAEPVTERLAHDDVDRVRAAVRGLSRRQQQCIVLRYYSDCNEAQIATTLGISAGSIKKHLARARSALASQLEDMP